MTDTEPYLDRIARGLSRMNGGAVWIDSMGSGGQSVMTKTELAGVLAGLPPLQHTLVWVKFVVHPEPWQPCNERDALLGMARREAVEIADEKGWGADRDTAHRMAEMAVMEVLHDFWCPGCGGTGKRPRREIAAASGQKPDPECPVCLSGRRAKVPQKFRAEYAGIKPTNWSMRWQPRYETIYGHLEALEKEALGAVGSRMAAA